MENKLTSRFKCLVLDHDDTAVKSTPQIHYPAFLEILDELRPGVKYTLEEFMIACFDPGFAGLCRDVLRFNEAEMKREYDIWKKYTVTHSPEFYEGFLDVVRDFKKTGGYITIVSHSDEIDIRRHYKEQGIEPDVVYGWDYPEHQRKPYPYPLQEIMKKYGLKPSECVVVDDLKLGYDMAKACGVFFCAAGWSHQFSSISEFMKKNSDLYLNTTEELRNFIFDL